MNMRGSLHFRNPATGQIYPHPRDYLRVSLAYGVDTATAQAILDALLREAYDAEDRDVTA